MTHYPLIYKSSFSGCEVKFRKVSAGKYERHDGKRFPISRMVGNYEFIRHERVKQRWITTINNFRVRVRI